MYNEYPYTDFHELNLDWFLNEFKAVHDHVDTLDATVTEFTNFVTNYFDNLDVQEEINNKLDALVADGTIAGLLLPLTTDAVGDWLEEHITPTTPPVDDTLTIAGAAADAKVTGDELSSLKEDLKLDNCYDYAHLFTHTNSTYNGITYTWNGDTLSVTGTATANSVSSNLYISTTDILDDFSAGDIIYFDIDSTDANIKLTAFWYRNSAWSGDLTMTSSHYVVITDTSVGILLRIAIASGATVNGTIKISVYKNPSNHMLYAAHPSLIAENTINMKIVIEKLLNEYGCVYLTDGDYHISTAIEMPEYSAIYGIGEKSKIIVDNPNQHGIIANKGCTVSNVYIQGVRNSAPNTKGTEAGIYVGSDSTEPLYNVKISDVVISGFNLGGIYVYKTGYWVANSVSAVNCKITNCYAGISCATNAEYSRFTNILTYNNYIGALINGGNNKFINCDFSNNSVGVYLDAHIADTVNNGHGSMVGCTLNHPDNNTGFSLICNSVTNGYIFDACHFWYGKIHIENSQGILITDSMFGNSSSPDFNIGSGSVVFLSSCIFKTTPTFTNYGTLIKNNCYMFDGTSIS